MRNGSCPRLNGNHRPPAQRHHSPKVFRCKIPIAWVLIDTMFAPEALRLEIILALRDRSRRFIDRYDTTSRGYLDRLAITAEMLYEDLADQLERFELDLKPKSDPKLPQKYRFVIPYGEHEDIPAIELHVTLSPRGKPLKVKLSVHPSNTGYASSGRTPLKTKSPDNLP